MYGMTKVGSTEVRIKIDENEGGRRRGTEDEKEETNEG